MPWINLTLRRGALSKPVQHAMMTKLTDVLMWWEKVPDTPAARKFLKGWVYEVAEDADYNAGSPDHDKPYYFIEVRIPIDRLDLLAKQGLIRDFTSVVLKAEGADNRPENARRVWVTINELRAEDWGIGGHTDWLRDYTSALDEVGDYKTPPELGRIMVRIFRTTEPNFSGDPAMHTLVERTIEAHGGLKHWNELESIPCISTEAEPSGASRGIPIWLGRPT